MIAALHQIGIATTIVNMLVAGFVGAIALAAGLAFGLGARDVAASIAWSWYENSRRVIRRVGPADNERQDAA
jgi:hypothetical protein